MKATSMAPAGLLLVVAFIMGAPWFVLLGLFVLVALTVSPA